MPSGLPRLLVFDLDGTLIDSSTDLCHSVNAALVHVGKQPLPNGIIAGYIGDGAAMLVRRALGDPGDIDSAPSSQPASEGLFERAFHFFLSYYHLHKLDHTTVYPGVLESLHDLRARHPEILMAVLTNKPVNPSRAICAALGLAPFFFQNYGGNSFPTKKPDPEGLLTLISEASGRRGVALHPADVVMIGDSDVDVLTARRCGARSVGCTYGLAPHSLTLVEPDLLVVNAWEWSTALGL
jgi:phosphoglycolate phosphatase